MKIAVSATGPNLESEVDPRFGRCACFVIIDPDNKKIDVLENSNAMAGGGAGIATAQMIVDQGVKVLLTGNVGPNAYQVLSAGNVQIISGISGTVNEAIEQFKQGNSEEVSGPTVDAHAGMNPGGNPGQNIGVGRGMGMGQGMGRGMGMGQGMGRGMGMGQGMGRGMGQAQGYGVPSGQPFTSANELQDLRTQADILQQQLQNIQQRINELNKRKDK